MNNPNGLLHSLMFKSMRKSSTAPTQSARLRTETGARWWAGTLHAAVWAGTRAAARHDAVPVVNRLDNHLLAPLRKSLALRSLDGFTAWVGIVSFAAAAGLFAHAWSERVGYAALADVAVHQLDLYSAGLESELSKYESLPSILELDENVFALLETPTDPKLHKKVNKSLLNLNVRAGTLAIMLMDARGIVLASSDWYAPDNLVGKDLSAAVFYTEAVSSGLASSFVADASRSAPECYFARAIVQRERVVGVVAVKVSLESIESTWIEYAAGSQSERLLVIDDNGVVIMSSNPAWRYMTTSPLSSAQHMALGRSNRYPPGILEPLGMRVERRLEYGTHLVRMTDGNLPAAEALFVAEEQQMARPGWRLMTLSGVAPVRRDAVNAAIGAAALGGLVGVLGLYLRQRRRAVAQRLAAREALERAKDELELRVLERTAALSDANTALIGEIGERKRTEEDLRDAQDELIQAGRLALLGQMSAAITHEINQPLTALRALSDNGLRLLKKGRINDVERNLESIAKLTERVGRITAQLKSFARKASAPAGSVRLDGAVANTLELLRGRIQDEGIDVRVDVPEGLRVRCDGLRLEQVLLNLCANALDAMKDRPVKRLLISTAPSDDSVRVSVTDTGTGLPETVLSRMFEPFFSTKPPGEGLGLGLVISSAIVREFGSALRPSNRPDGAAFEFELKLETEVHHA
jgi:C4-dicarboxylate-specific signal transduction histidine kinase